MKLLWLLSLAGLLAACGRTPLDPHGLTQAGGGAGTADAGNPPQTGGRPGIDDAGQGTCYATCSTPPGPVQIYPSNAELAAGLVGVWRICSGGPSLFTGAPSDTIGVEFAPGFANSDLGIEGDVYFLKKGPSGPVRGQGADYQQTYEVDEGVIYCRSTSRDIGSDFSLKYSPCPREWWFENEYRWQTGTLASF